MKDDVVRSHYTGHLIHSTATPLEKIFGSHAYIEGWANIIKAGLPVF